LTIIFRDIFLLSYQLRIRGAAGLAAAADEQLYVFANNRFIFGRIDGKS